LNVRSSLARDDPVSICPSPAKTEVASAKEINASVAANDRHRIITIVRRRWATFVASFWRRTVLTVPRDWLGDDGLLLA
jgi:hypothetical protein